MRLAYGVELILNRTVVDRWEDTSIDELERVPLSRTLRLEVPPEPALCLALKGRDLGLDVTSGVVFVRGGPLGEIVLPAALADEAAARVGAVVARADAKAVQVLCAVTGGRSVCGLHALCV
jgi:hypothetical protein